MNLTQNLILQNIEELNKKMDALTKLIVETREQAKLINESNSHGPAIGSSGDYTESQNSEK